MTVHGATGEGLSPYQGTLLENGDYVAARVALRVAVSHSMSGLAEQITAWLNQRGQTASWHKSLDPAAPGGVVVTWTGDITCEEVAYDWAPIPVWLELYGPDGDVRFRRNAEDEPGVQQKTDKNLSLTVLATDRSD